MLLLLGWQHELAHFLGKPREAAKTVSRLAEAGPPSELCTQKALHPKTPAPSTKQKLSMKYLFRIDPELVAWLLQMLL